MKVYNYSGTGITCPIYLSYNQYQINVGAEIVDTSVNLFIDENFITGTTFNYKLNINTTENSGITQAHIFKNINNNLTQNDINIQPNYNNPIDLASYQTYSVEVIQAPLIGSNYAINVLTADEYNSLVEYDKNTLYFIK